jgi:cAMP-dependent protein kinase regulator
VEGNELVLKYREEGEEKMEVGRIGKYDYFGEIDMILERKREDKVVEKGKIKCVKLERERFERVMGMCEEIMKRKIKK